MSDTRGNHPGFIATVQAVTSPQTTESVCIASSADLEELVKLASVMPLKEREDPARYARRQYRQGSRKGVVVVVACMCSSLALQSVLL